MLNRFVAGAAILVGSSIAVGQHVVTHRVDDLHIRHKSEPALRVCCTTREVMVAWHEHYGLLHTRTHYNVWAADASGFRNDPGNIPLPPGADLRGVDPMVGFSNNGTGWVGCLFKETVGPFNPWYFWLATKYPGDAYAQEAVQTYDLNPSIYYVDKGVLVAGPPPGGGSDVLHLVYARGSYGDTNLRLGAMFNTPTSSIPVGSDEGGNIGGAQWRCYCAKRPGHRGPLGRRAARASRCYWKPGQSWTQASRDAES